MPEKINTCSDFLFHCCDKAVTINNFREKRAYLVYTSILGSNSCLWEFTAGTQIGTEVETVVGLCLLTCALAHVQQTFFIAQDPEPKNRPSHNNKQSGKSHTEILTGKSAEEIP